MRHFGIAVVLTIAACGNRADEFVGTWEFFADRSTIAVQCNNDVPDTTLGQMGHFTLARGTTSDLVQSGIRWVDESCFLELDVSESRAIARSSQSCSWVELQTSSSSQTETFDFLTFTIDLDSLGTTITLSGRGRSIQRSSGLGGNTSVTCSEELTATAALVAL